jgi:hypothetical protein
MGKTTKHRQRQQIEQYNYMGKTTKHRQRQQIEQYNYMDKTTKHRQRQQIDFYQNNTVAKKSHFYFINTLL